jgi:hypothetical protein
VNSGASYRTVTGPRRTDEAGTGLARSRASALPRPAEWNGHTADALGRSRITHADTLRILVRRLLNDPDLAASVVDDLRSQ